MDIAAGIVGVAGTALHFVRLLADDIENIINAPHAVKSLQADLLNIEGGYQRGRWKSVAGVWACCCFCYGRGD